MEKNINAGIHYAGTVLRDGCLVVLMVLLVLMLDYWPPCRAAATWIHWAACW